MKKLITIFIVVGITLLAAFFTPILMKDPGYFLIRFAGYEIEMRFVVAFGLFVLAVLLFWLVVYFIRLPKKTVNSFTTNRSRKSFAKGLLALSEGKWKQAEKLLIISTKNSPTPELGFMAAARAAVAQNNFSQAFAYLDEAEINTDNPLTVDLTRSELWIKIEENDKALNLLNRILKSYPNNQRALYLMAQVSHNAEQWQQLRAILPKIEKLEIYPQEKVKQLMQHTIAQQLNLAENETELQQIWKSLNKEQKLSLEYLGAYAQNGLKLGMSDQVAKLTETALSKSLSNELLETWSQLNIDNNHKIKTAEKWLKKNSKNAYLLQILAQFCMDNKLWGKAKSYLDESLALNPTSATFKLMAQYFDANNDPSNALEAYRQAQSSHNQLVLTDESSVVEKNIIVED